jgi:hypothetical protein
VTTTTFTPAKRGDLVIIVQQHRDYVIGTGSVESTTCEIGIISSVTRAGAVKAYRSPRYRHEPGGGQSVPLAYLPRATALLVPAASIDLEAALSVAEEHCWYGDGREFDSYRPFDSVDEVRAALKPCLIEDTNSSGKAGTQR